MKNKTATIIGSTGLVGSHILQIALNDSFFDKVRILVRKASAVNHPKLEVVVTDFNSEQSLRRGIEENNIVFCAVGTTQNKVKGDKDAYRKVDYDIPVHAARLAKECGCNVFLLVSSVGADSKSNNFYLKLKGEVEDAVKQIGLQSVHIFRPSMLLGNRQESRPAEKIGQVVMKLFSFLIPSKYKPIKASAVAKAMVAASKNQETGFHIYHYREMEVCS